MPKTTKEILTNIYHKVRAINKQIQLSDVLWYSQDEIEQLKKELKDYLIITAIKGHIFGFLNIPINNYSLELINKVLNERIDDVFNKYLKPHEHNIKDCGFTEEQLKQAEIDKNFKDIDY